MGYALTVAKSGLKIKESPVQNEAPASPPFERPTSRDADGFPLQPKRPGPYLMQQSVPDYARILGQQQTMQDLAQILARQLNTTVTDATGLATKYDFTINYQGNMGPGGAVIASTIPASDIAAPFPDIFTALQSQLGLKLEARKVPVEIFVVDHMEKTPTGN